MVTMLLTHDETMQLISLLRKASPRSEVAGTYKVLVTPTIFTPEDFKPYKRVCIDDVKNVVGQVDVEAAQDYETIMGILGEKGI